MGNLNSTDQLTVVVENNPGLWVKKQTIGYCTIVVNKLTGLQAEECSVSLEGRLSLQQQLERYQYRSQESPYFVQVYEVEMEDRQLICHGREHAKVRTERIVWRLAEIPKFNQYEALYVLRQALYGYQIIFQIEGSISLSEEMIGVTPQGKVKVWLNENFAKNLPEKQALIHQNQMVMVDHVIDIVREHTQNRQFPVYFNKLLQQKQPNTFNEAIERLQQYLNSTRTLLPEKLSLNGTGQQIIAGRINPINNRVLTAEVPRKSRDTKRVTTAEQVRNPVYVKPTESMNTYMVEKRNSNQGITFTYAKANTVPNEVVNHPGLHKPVQQAKQYHGHPNNKPPLNKPPLPQNTSQKTLSPNVKFPVQKMDQVKPQNAVIRPSGSSTQINFQATSQVRRPQPYIVTNIDQQETARQQASQVTQFNKLSHNKIGTAVQKTEGSLQSQIERLKEIAHMSGLNKQQPKKPLNLDGQVSFVSPATQSKHIKFEKTPIIEGQKIYIKAPKQQNINQLQPRGVVKEAPIPPMPPIRQIQPIKRATQTIRQQKLQQPQSSMMKPPEKATKIESHRAPQNPPPANINPSNLSNEVEQLDNLQKMLNEAVAATKAINSNKQALPASLMIRRPVDS